VVNVNEVSQDQLYFQKNLRDSLYIFGCWSWSCSVEDSSRRKFNCRSIL